jgi:hypothetical protein
MLAVSADMGFVTVEALVVFARVTRVGIRRATFARGLGVGAFTAGLHQRRIHQRDAFDDTAALLQLGVEQAEQFLMQAAINKPLTKPADRRFIRHGLVRVELHKLLEAQPILDLFFGLGITQSVEVLQDHDAQPNADAAGRSPAVTVGGGDALLGGSGIYFASDGFQDSVGAAALLHGQIKKGRLVFSFGLHDFSDHSITRAVQKQKDFCRDFSKLLEVEETLNALQRATRHRPRFF